MQPVLAVLASSPLLEAKKAEASTHCTYFSSTSGGSKAVRGSRPRAVVVVDY